jgi:hypothetical protein
MSITIYIFFKVNLYISNLIKYKILVSSLSIFPKEISLTQRKECGGVCCGVGVVLMEIK